MLYTNFSQNWNNKLLNNSFGTIRTDDSYQLHQEREIRLCGKTIGIAKVVAIRTFHFCNLTDNVAYVDAGHDARYMSNVFCKMHGPLEPHRMICWVIFEWLQPDMAAMQTLYAKAWEKLHEKFAPAYNDTPHAPELSFP